MNSQTKGILATVAAVVLCGCPGLFLCVWGAIGVTGAPINTELNGVSSSAPMSTSLAIGLLCGAVLLMLIPVVVGFLSFRKKPAPPMSSAPLPPAS